METWRWRMPKARHDGAWFDGTRVRETPILRTRGWISFNKGLIELCHFLCVLVCESIINHDWWYWHFEYVWMISVKHDDNMFLGMSVIPHLRLDNPTCTYSSFDIVVLSWGIVRSPALVSWPPRGTLAAFWSGSLNHWIVWVLDSSCIFKLQPYGDERECCFHIMLSAFGGLILHHFSWGSAARAREGQTRNRVLWSP